jgi:outer membrane receptor protein involved in Fe transport
VTVNYISGYSVAGVTAQTHVSPFVLTNLVLSYNLDGVREFLSGSTFSLNINNIFNEESPFINTGQGYPIAPLYESTLGRLFQVSLTKKF